MITLDEAREILAQEYHIENFAFLMKDVLLPDFKADKHEVAFRNDIFSSVMMLGASDACEVNVFEVKLVDGVHNRRVAITQEMFRILRGLRINNALVAFANADGKNYRISLLTSKYEYDGEKVVRVLSNPRRYSYSLGLGTKTKTAYKFLIGKGKVEDLNDLITRFSVEVVNKQFYSEIATSFTSLVGGDRDGKHYEKLLKVYGTEDHNKYAEFAVRLIGRIMFCWFLREKRSDKNIPLVPDDMLSLDMIRSKTNYYHDILEPLFFELLNTNQKKRKACFQNDYYKQIPYLNGGLFSPQTDDRYKFDQVNNGGQYGIITIPNEWFLKFYQTLGQYNFTVDENTAYDIELSIDPEMLGRIFENLLAEINPETGENAKKSTGSFYTPRDIVDFMVDSSLCEYLKTKTDIDEGKLNALISYSKDDDDLAVFDKSEKKQLIDALYTVTVLDPACGSGAFPIGMLQKVVYILQELDPDANLWFDKATENVGILLKKEFEKKFNAGSLNYIRKLSVIQNSIFGVDIQPIAVEISRLRCFLSLIIEEKVDDTEENRGINPLPNLDFKFIIANSLITLESTVLQYSMFENQDDIKRLKDIREEYFNADSERRTELKLEFLQVQQDMLLNTIANYQKQASARYQQLSEWKPFENQATSWFDPEWMFGIKDGFDIVIGNPPYLESRHSNFSERLKDKLQAQLHSRYGKNFDLIPRGSDLLIYFYELSLRTIKENGVNVFITQNSWLDTEYGFKFQKYLRAKTNVLSIIDSDFKSFETANINTVITVFQGNKGCIKDVVFARLHVRYGDYRLTQNEIRRGATAATIKVFEPKNPLIKSYKWGFLFNSDSQLIELLNQLNLFGKKEEETYWLKVGQGLNITKDYANKKNTLPSDVKEPELIAYLTVDENGYYVWDKSETYLLSNKEMSKDREEQLHKEGYSIYNEKENKRSRPALILPRGIGNKHFCSFNKNKGYSASCVDIYISKEDRIPNLWLFMNTTLFWLLREIAGRKSLGGGMLKAEAVDLKQFPLYFAFGDIAKIGTLMKEAEGKKVLSATEEIETDFHKQIDSLFYDELNISFEIQDYIKKKFIEQFNARTQKSTT